MDNTKVLVSLSLAVMALWTGSVAKADVPSLQGTLRFKGESVINHTRAEPRFWFRNEDTGKEASASVKYKHGKFKAYGLAPGRYGVAVTVDANPANPISYPGDLRTWATFSVTRNNTARLDVKLKEIIHMTSPEDNGAPLPEWHKKCEDKVTFRAPVKFAWVPIAPGAYYDYKISKTQCEPFKYLDAVASGTTKETSIVVPLPPNEPNEFYRFTVNARKDGRSIGFLIVHGGNGYGWDYRFRAAEAGQDVPQSQPAVTSGDTEALRKPSSLRGELKGNPFVPERIELKDGGLEFSQGDRYGPDLLIKIALRQAGYEVSDGKTEKGKREKGKRKKKRKKGISPIIDL